MGMIHCPKTAIRNDDPRARLRTSNVKVTPECTPVHANAR